MKVAVKGGAAVDPESGSDQHLTPSPPLPSYPAGLFNKLKTCNIFLSSFSTYLLAFCHECHSLIGYSIYSVIE